MPCGSSKVQIVSLAAVTLAMLVAVAGYALFRLETLSLPIPTAIGVMTILVPFLAAAVIQRAIAAARGVGPRPAWLGTLVFTLSVLETVLATLAGSHLIPVSGLRCALDDRWQTLFQAMNGNAIRRVQDALGCCGLHSLDDMSWPFPANSTDARTCAALTGRTRSCFLQWRKEEQGVAGMVLVVVVMAFVWKIIGLMLVPARIGGIRWESADRGNGTGYRDDPTNGSRGTRSSRHSRRARRPQLIPGEQPSYGAIEGDQGNATQSQWDTD